MTHGPPKEGAFCCYQNPKEDKDIMQDDWNNDARLILRLKYFQAHFPCLAGNLFYKTQNCPNITAQQLQLKTEQVS